MTFSTILKTFGCIALFLGVMTMQAGASALPDEQCVGIAVDIGSGDDEEWELTCLGTCTSPPDCEPIPANDPGFGDYEYCPVCDTSTESACCHIVCTTGSTKQKRTVGGCGPQQRFCPFGTSCDEFVSPDDPGNQTRWVAYCD